MDARAFDSDASRGQRRVIVRRDGGGVEMVELPWGLRPLEAGGRSFTLVRAEGRAFPSHRCLVPASEVHGGRGGPYTYALADGDWFYLAGIWRPAARGWPEAFAVLTVAANPDIAPLHDRQIAVIRRDARMVWLDLTQPETELLRPLPAGTFTVTTRGKDTAQMTLAI
ncbi:SOS response-associated peptidase family protein [uncultured Amaricoccus sp.]|uniref:SOS response-associated peptidase family protein n=1 Tax=uncultured Amaricoccus sp. TaxID=339341 RepID=UPI00260FAD93|nr:SOS response-associated peptidase family protein [uncultured Amaricoccus sp.]